MLSHYICIKTEIDQQNDVLSVLRGGGGGSVGCGVNSGTIFDYKSHPLPKRTDLDFVLFQRKT